MKIGMEEIVPPVAVVAAQILAAKSTTPTILGQPTQRVVNYGLAGGGYLAAAMGWGGRYSEYIKNIAIAAAPAALLGIYNAVVGGDTPVQVSRAAKPISMRRVSRYPGPAAESPFQGVRLV